MQNHELFTNTYAKKRVLLTGHTGFKGSWLLTWLHQLGAEVKGYSLAPEDKHDLYNLVDGDSMCDSIIGDIRDNEKLKKTVLDFKPDFIFHLAAQALVRRSYEVPLYTFEVNVNGTAHVLEAVRDLQYPCNVVVITTDKVYENQEIHYAYKENDKLGGYDPYSASKAAAEIVVSSYRNSFFKPSEFSKHNKAIATARAGNVIGGGDWARDRILPDIIRALKAGESVIVRNPGAIRPWQHVLEPVGGYLLLGAKLAESPEKYADAWNFGPETDDVMTVEQLVVYAIQTFGTGTYELCQPNTKQPHEANLLQLDISKAARELPWSPKMDAAKAIKESIRWYQQFTPENAQQLTLQQILDYQQS